MAKLIKVTSVTLTLPTTYLLQVDSSSGVLVNDYFADLTGKIYRVLSIDNATHITVFDDVSPFAPYGSPSIGTGSIFTPTPTLKLSQLPFDAPGWDNIVRRDFKVLDTSGGGGGSGSGWLSITDVSVSSGVASNKTYDDSPNNTVLQSVTVSGLSLNVTVKASAPHVTVGSTSDVLSLDVSGAFYTGSVAVTILGSGQLLAQLTTPDGNLGAADTISITYQPPPTITSISFTGSYPGVQTELKAGDTFQVTGTTNVSCVGVEVQAFGAGTSEVINFSPTTTFVVDITIADQGNVLQALSAQLRAKDANGAYGAIATTSNTVNLNNLHPTVTFGAKTYPGGQSALKASESATVAVTLANLDSVSFTSPNGDLSIASPGSIGSPKTVTRIAGSYNIATNNLSCTATRSANAATTTASTVVNIANVAPSITVSLPAARLRSGGNDGTSVQGHVITLISDQQLLSAPTLLEGVGGGTFLSSWAGGPTTWTRTLNVHDDDVKGTYTFNGLVATGLSGIDQNSVTGSADYVLGGFVSRDLTFDAFSQSTNINTGVVTYSKLQASSFSATGGSATRNPSQGDTSNLVNNFTVLTLADSGPITLFWNDVAASATNSSGTAQIISVQETV